jgi:hypothetical protein
MLEMDFNVLHRMESVDTIRNKNLDVAVHAIGSRRRAKELGYDADYRSSLENQVPFIVRDGIWHLTVR